jgi:hypothetical protein
LALDTRYLDQDEARNIATVRLNELRRLAFVELRDRFLKNPLCEQVVGESGGVYQIEATDFIVRPDGSFVGD